MTSDVVATLTRWRVSSDGPWVFPGRDGGVERHPNSANMALTRRLAVAGLRKVRVHDLRHSFASHLVLRGVSLRVIQRIQSP